jgi:hypothetical protein
MYLFLPCRFMAGAKAIAVPCELHPMQSTIIAIDINCSVAGYHALQSKCMKPDSMEFDYDKLERFMQLFYAEKFCLEALDWKMEGIKQWDEALEEVYNKYF